eukprot:scaffold52868_cov63-Phaeocystis_antarctica.AAC.6
MPTTPRRAQTTAQFIEPKWQNSIEKTSEHQPTATLHVSVTHTTHHGPYTLNSNVFLCRFQNSVHDPALETSGLRPAPEMLRRLERGGGALDRRQQALGGGGNRLRAWHRRRARHRHQARRAADRRRRRHGERRHGECRRWGGGGGRAEAAEAGLHARLGVGEPAVGGGGRGRRRAVGAGRHRRDAAVAAEAGADEGRGRLGA